jgi:hypothetical protein
VVVAIAVQHLEAVPQDARGDQEDLQAPVIGGLEPIAQLAITRSRVLAPGRWRDRTNG